MNFIRDIIIRVKSKFKHKKNEPWLSYYSDDYEFY